jgi:hypothetical protein
MNPFGLIFVAAGLFSICGGVFDWDFYMNNRKARFIVGIFGRSGARIFYVLLGLALVVLGALFVAGIIEDAS